MELTLNPFALVAEHQEQYQFIGAGVGNIRAYSFNAVQKKMIDTLASGKFCTEKELQDVLGDSIVSEMLQHGWLIDHMPDITGMDSRTTAFYRQYGMNGTEHILQEKSVLILGCGGIGTHLAWHMVLLGIGKLTLVDFDTVEESNLNRQLLFDRRDIGRDKVTALREKLLQIRPEAEINAISTRISSQQELEALCTAEKYDLLIKALDTPADFPLWLDAVCKKHRLAYTAGITLQNQVLIGPTFIPGQSEKTWTDILGFKPGAEKKYGTAPSIGLMLYRISDAIATECFKLLAGKGTLCYTGKIVAENIFTNQVEVFGETTTSPEQGKVIYGPSPAVGLLGVILLGIGGMLRPLLFAFAFLFSITAPLLLYRGQEMLCARAAFVNSLLTGILFLLRFGLTVCMFPTVQVVFLMTAVFCVVSLAALMSCAITAFVVKQSTGKGAVYADK